MKISKTLIASVIGGLGLLASTGASAIVAGGVDFGAGFFDHLETTTIAETIVTGNNQTFIGYGQVNTVNGNLQYTTPGQSLYFVFSGYQSQNFSASHVDFTGGTVQVYLGPTLNLLTQSSPTNVATIQGYTPWLTLAGHADGTGFTLQTNGQLTGSTISFTGAGLLDVVGGLPDVVAALNSNTIADGVGGFADIAMTTSGNNRVLNSHDVAAGLTTGCKTNQATVGSWCIAGSADLRGDLTVVPEPASLALVGLSLLGVGVASQRKRKS